MKKRKLTLKKYTILRLGNLSQMRGGSGVTTATGSAATTYTTDPAIPCPPEAPTTHPVTTNDPNNNNSIPTMNEGPEGLLGP